jgi:Multiubiquitin
MADQATSTTPDASVASGPRFEVNIEGVLHPWDTPTITVPELRALGGLPADQPVLEVNLQDNTERTLDEDTVVELKPGLGFAKKVRFKRG